MRLRVVVLVALSLTAAGGAAYMTNSWLQSQQQQAARPEPVEAEPEPVKTKVLVASEQLTAGSILKSGDLSWQAWPEDGVLDSYVVQAPEYDPKTLEGAVVRSTLMKGEPVTETRVVRPGDRGFLAAMLKEGHRALSVPVTATSGISGLIFPGDRVDVIMTHSVAPMEKGDRERRASETVLSDIRIMALDQRTDDVDGERVVAKTATLEVTPKQAERLSLAQQLGALSLVLRPIARDEESDAPSYATITTDSQVSRLMRGPRNDDKVVVMRGSETSESAVADDADN